MGGGGTTRHPSADGPPSGLPGPQGCGQGAKHWSWSKKKCDFFVQDTQQPPVSRHTVLGENLRPSGVTHKIFT